MEISAPKGWNSRKNHCLKRILRPGRALSSELPLPGEFLLLPASPNSRLHSWPPPLLWPASPVCSLHRLPLPFLLTFASPGPAFFLRFILRSTLRVISEKLNPPGLGASRLAHCSALRAQIGSALKTYVHSWISQFLATSIRRSSFVHFEYCFVGWKDLFRKNETHPKIIA